MNKPWDFSIQENIGYFVTAVITKIVSDNPLINSGLIRPAEYFSVWIFLVNVCADKY